MKNKIIEKISLMTNLHDNKPVDTDKFMRSVEYNQDEDKVVIILNYLGENQEKNKLMQREIIKLCKIDLEIKGVKVSYYQAPQMSKIGEDTKVIAVMSGKGGVGKSEATVQLAKALRRKGKKVGIIDNDIYGYSIPRILNLYGEPKVKGSQIIPLVSEEDIQVISSQYFLEDNENKAIMWRAPMINKMMKHFVYDVLWDPNLDYILLDMPPGTGDLVLNLNQHFTDLYAVVVTTPSKNASHVAIRAGQVADSLKMSVLGVIENMSYFVIDGKKNYIFGQGGGQIVADELKTTVLEQIEINENSSELHHNYDNIVEKIIKVL